MGDGGKRGKARKFSIFLGYLLLGYCGFRLLPHNKWHSFLGLIGSILVVVPPARQMLANRIFHEATKHPTSVQELTKVQKAIETLAAKEYMKFSWTDVVYFFSGALLLCASYVSDLVGW